MNKPPLLHVTLSQPEDWLRQHGDALFRYAFFRTRDRTQAEDLVQETLLAALKARHGFVGRSSERTWLVGILKNKLADHLRKSGRQQLFGDLAETDEELDALFETSAGQHWKTPPADWDNPARALEQKQFWKVFAECVSTLPTRQAQAFSLCELDGLDGEEVCNILGITTTNLWVMLHRARLRLRQCLEAHWFDREAGR